MAIVVTMILTTILAVLISIRVSNNFTHKLGVIQRWAKRISEYNVSEDITEIGKDEFGITTKALNDSQFMIRDLVEKIMEESTTMSDTGKEVSEAIRKSKKRLENMNLTVAQASAAEKEFLQKVIDTMLDEDISPSFMSKMKELLDMIEKNSIESEEFCKELTGMATYMEQIAITSDYQNEMAKTHREQVGKFKIN
ncbi:MAG: methyl-accepting chemotaxis protein [Lachnospiraceae bacterium]|nr:methyl-accepting chemotaxis protein [Lachnospiraceae bacterium]